jgi:integrase
MSKRKYGTGSIEKKNGSIHIVYRPYRGGPQVSEKVGRIEDGTTMADAEELLEERRVEARKGLIPKNRVTLAEAAAEWRDVQLHRDRAPKTHEEIKTALDCHLLPAFGLDRLDRIAPDLLRSYIFKKLHFAPGHQKAAPVAGKVAGARKSPLGKTAVRKQIQTLSKIFKWAIERGMATTNPCDFVDKTDLTPDQSDVKVFEIEEVKALLQAAKDEEERAILLMMAACGLRIGEVFALKSGEYDPDTATLHLKRTIQRDGGSTRIGKKPKTSSGDRFLVLDPQVARAVEGQVERVREEGREKNGLLFPNTVGNVRSAENFRFRSWKRLLKTAGLPPDRTPHSLRHTFASELIQARKSDTDIAAKMGHKNAQITRQIYAKPFERTKASAAGVVDLYLDSEE